MGLSVRNFGMLKITPPLPTRFDQYSTRSREVALSSAAINSIGTLNSGKQTSAKPMSNRRLRRRPARRYKRAGSPRASARDSVEYKSK